MKPARRRFFTLHSLLFILLLLAGCAQMGSPDGGWYDETPPKILSTTPDHRGTDVNSRKVSILFNEYVKIEDASSKVVVSPPQVEAPEIKSAGKKIIVELKDSLKPESTYTIDFSDAIEDNNEGNPLGNYTFSFSTGSQIDTLEASGTVLDASNLEPVSSILVGLYEDMADTALTHRPFDRVARTDSRGHFIIRGLAPKPYRVYALQDADGDYMYTQKSEMVAFTPDVIEPSCRPDVRQDTLWRDSLHIDTIVRVGYTHFLPDNIVLRAFTQEQTDRYLIKTDRQDADRLKFFFSYGDSISPIIRGLNFDSDDAFIEEATEKKDTIVYWIKDSLLINNDSLIIEATYHMTDTLGLLAWQTDTIEMIPRMAYEKRKKLEEKDMEEWLKAEEKKKKKGLPYDSVRKPKPLNVEIFPRSSLDPDKNVQINVPTPLAHLDTAAIHLYSKIDTLWYRARIAVESAALRSFTLRAEWRPGIEYSLEIDSAAFTDIYGRSNDAIKTGLRVKSEDEYSTLMVNLSGLPILDSCYVQILNSSDNPIKTCQVQDGTAEFYYLSPGKYYMRAFIDMDGDGLWDTGNYNLGLQPEQVFYYGKEVELKAKWDVTLSWDLSRKPLNEQKPLAITKQKDEKSKSVNNRNQKRAQELGIKYVKEEIEQ